MPELPEMETYKKLLNQHVSGKPVTNVQVTRRKSINVDLDIFMKNILNKKIDSVERKAKHLLFHLSDGQVLLLHLMLGGWMFYGTNEEKPDRTIQVQFSFGDKHLYFIGLRLGYLHLLPNGRVAEELADLGPEPLSSNFTPDTFNELLKNRRGRLKTTLVDQSFLSGIGNCYSDEIAWHAQLMPERKMNDLTDDEIKRLYQSIRFVLQQAIQFGGYMDNPFFVGDNVTGGYDQHKYVYDGEGKQCRRCGTPIIKKEISSRKTFYCKGCQK